MAGSKRGGWREVVHGLVGGLAVSWLGVWRPHTFRHAEMHVCDGRLGPTIYNLCTQMAITQLPTSWTAGNPL